MNILQVVPYFYPAWAYGGPAKLVYDTSLYFSKKKHHVTVLTTDAYDASHRFPDKLKLKPSKNFVVQYCRNISNTLAYRFNISFAPQLFLRAVSAVQQADIVHLHDFYTLHNVWITLLCAWYRKPYVLSVHGCLEDVRMKQRAIWKTVFMWLFGYRMLHGAALCIATSANEFRSYLVAGVQKQHIQSIGHGVNKPEFMTKKSKHAVRAALSLPHDSVVFTYVGRLHSIKGLDLLIHAFAQLKRKNAYLVIAGSDDGYLSTIQSLITKHSLQNKVKLLPACFGAEKSRLFKATDVFVYPSRSEGFSLGILEAASIGLPLLITTACHFPAVQKVEGGVIVPPSQAGVLHGLNTFVRMSQAARMTMGKNMDQYIQRTYSMQSIGDRLLGLYRDASHH